MVQKTLLLIAPCEKNDAFTEEFSSVAAKKVKEKAEQSGWNSIALEGSKANKEEVAVALGNNNIDFLIHYGHGDPDEMRGENDEEVININNIGEMKGKTISTVSCQTTKILGRESIQNQNIRSYIGYREKYYSYIGLQWILDQLIQASIIANQKLLEGKTCEEAYNSQVEAYNNLKILFFQKYENTQDIRYMIAAVCTDFNCESLEQLGDSSARV